MSLKRSAVDDADIELLDRDDPMQRMPFLGSGSKVGRSVGSRFFNYSRHFRKFGIFLAILAALVFVFDTWGDAFLNWMHSDLEDALTPDVDKGQPLHVLLPATHRDVNLCKATLGLNILDYPEPVFLGWGKTYDDPNMRDGGAQIGTKITEALAYVKTLTSDEDLVLIADGFDTWFQLPQSVLRARYFMALERANWRMRHRLGRRAIRRESMKNNVVFAVGKACQPNGLHTVACFPIIEPPTIPDMYYENTDSDNGKTKHAFHRPRYLDAGFMMGYAKEVRAILERAQELVNTLPPTETIDTPYAKQTNEGMADPARPSSHLYNGDPQGIFARIFGEQVYQREVIRLRYRSWFKKYSPPHTPGWLEGRKYKDVINPPFKHESMKPLNNHPREYGITLDYTALLGGSTSESELDFRALQFDGRWNLTNIPGPNIHDCKPNIRPILPKQIKKAELPKHGPESWEQATKLFTNLCLGNVPVMIHHNGKKDLRDRANWWKQVWYQLDSAKMLQAADESKKDSIYSGAGASDQRGEFLAWRDICPAEYDDEIFGQPLAM